MFNSPVADMGRMVGDNLPPDLKVQLQNSMRSFCRPRTGTTMFGSSSHEGTQVTVPISGIQTQASLNTVPDGRVQMKATDVPPSWALTWAQEIENDAGDSAPFWASIWADEIEKQESTLRSVQVKWEEAEQWAKELTEEWERTRSRSPLRRVRCASLKEIHCNDPVDKESLLPSVDTLLDQAKTAQYLRSKASIAADECHRVVKPGTKISQVTDAAALLLSANLYGPPHVTKAHMTKGKVTGILVKPNFGGSVSLYLRTGKIIVDGNSQARTKLVKLLDSISVSCTALAKVGAELPSVDAVRATLTSK